MTIEVKCHDFLVGRLLLKNLTGHEVLLALIYSTSHCEAIWTVNLGENDVWYDYEND